MKDIVAFSSNFLAYPVICGSFTHNGLMMSLSLYPIRYLRDFFVPYDSFLETNILLTSMSSILYFFVFAEGTFIFFYFFCKRCSDFFVIKIYVLPTHYLYTTNKKKTTKFLY